MASIEGLLTMQNIADLIVSQICVSLDLRFKISTDATKEGDLRQTFCMTLCAVIIPDCIITTFL